MSDLPRAHTFITRAQAIEKFGLTKRGLEKQAAQRRGAYCIKLGRAVRYPLDERGNPLPWPAEKPAA